MVLCLCASNGRPLAVIIADRSAARDRALLKGAVGASRMALENAQLQADLKAKLKETRASRTRIVEASLAERRRLERDLHDGAQQRLLGLAATLQAAQTHATDPAVIAALELAALADRVNAMGGELDIVSPPGGGTHLEARIPCA